MKKTRHYRQRSGASAQKLVIFALSLLAAPLAYTQTSPTPAANKVPASTKDEDIIELTPFTVDATKDSGYYAENTLAGSRMRSNLADIAASISVITKQQMDDTGSLDINDVFRYEVSTEGSSTYTPQVLDRGTYKDTIAGYTFGNDGSSTTNAQSNRVRGLSAPEASLNYFQVSSSIPLDAYNTQSIEISRGPNSMLFGLGAPAGVVNQTASQASLTKDTAKVSSRTDQNGSFRTSLDFNRVLIKNKLAIFGAALYNKQKFERKPSDDTTKRYYGAITFKPFKKTTIRAFAESYKNNANRPNTVMPRDYASNWAASGHPAYDSLNRTVTILDSGKIVGPYANTTNSPYAVMSGTALANGYSYLSSKLAANSSYFVPGIAADNANRWLVAIDGDKAVNTFARAPQFYAPAQTSPATTTPSGKSLGWTNSDHRWEVMDRTWTSSTCALLPMSSAVTGGDYYTTYYTPTVTDKKLYDYTKYSVNQQNFSESHSRIYNAELEQEILPNLFFNAAWLRQDISSTSNNTLSQLLGATLAIDTNLRLPDGSTNPYFGLPFIEDSPEKDTFYTAQVEDNGRAALAYSLDFTQKNNWMKWLGSHRFLVMGSGSRRKGSIERWRQTSIAGDTDGYLRYGTNLATSGAAAYSSCNFQRNYYMASPGDPWGTVTHSTGNYGNLGWNTPNVNSVRVYDYTNDKFTNVSVTNAAVLHEAGSYRTERKVNSWNYAVQSNLWKDRIITTLGWRDDVVKIRRTQTGSYVADDGTQVAALTTSQLFTNGIANYDLVMNQRWTRWEEITDSSATRGIAFRPLKSWHFTSSDSFVSELLSGLTFYYNESGNFNPPSDSKTDYFKNPLPKPDGEGKDYGFGFSILKNKLVGRVTWFETTQNNDRASTAATLLTRAAYGDTRLMYNWAATVVRLRKGADTSVTNWNTDGVNPVTSDADQAAVYKLMGLPVNYYSGVSVAGTQTSEAKGVEAQLTYNPTPNWTMKFTGSKQETKYNNIAPEYDAWVNTRMPVWTSAKCEIADFTDGSGRQYHISDFWSGYGYSEYARIENTAGSTSSKSYWDGNVASEEATARALQGAISPLQSRWRASLLTNYNFSQGKLKGWGVGMAERYQSRTALGYFGKKSDPTSSAINMADISRPIWGSAKYYTDLWVSYSTKIHNGKVGMKIQLNVANVFEKGGLEAINANWDGSIWAWRIVDPRQFTLTATFSM
jgi:outer membrane receptor protein involved in Fe transport